MADRNGSTMEFTDVYMSEEAVETSKHEEVVFCRIVKSTNTRNGVERHSMSLQVYVDNPETGYQGWAKGKSISFNDPKQIDDLIEELGFLRDQWVAEGLTAQNGVDSSKPVVKRKGQKRSEASPRKQTAPKSPARKRAAAKR